MTQGSMISPSDPLHGKVILITGGGKGIGRAVTKIAVSRGARVWISGRDSRALKQTAEDLSNLGGTISWFQGDVGNSESCKALIEGIIKKEGRLDVLINNAGMSMRGTWEETDPKVLETMISINLLGPGYLTHYALPFLTNTKGSVIFVSSLTALRGLPMVGAYGVGKAGLKSMAETLDAELHPRGIHVGIVHVGFTENDPGKLIYSKDGSLVPLNRPKNSMTQDQTAAKIIHCLVKRRFEMTLTPEGKIAHTFYRFFPRLAGWIMRTFASGSEQYGSR